MTFSRRRWGLALLAASLPTSLPTPARAHAILLRSTPAAGATVPQGALAITLTFNSRLDRARSRLTLVRPGGATQVLTLTAEAEETLTATATLTPGAHKLRWQVLAIDGHITRGEFPFTVAAA